MVRSAYAFHLARNARRFGVRTGEVAIDWAEAIDQKNRVVRQLRAERRAELEDLGVHLVVGKAEFVSHHELAVGERQLEAERIVLAVGSRPAILPIPGAELTITSDHVLAMRALPESVAIIGGGAIAMEFAQMWNTVGVRVTVLEIGERILGSSDEEMVREVARLSAERGMEILTRTHVESVSGGDGSLVVRARTPDGQRDVQGSRVLMAVGRWPNSEGMGLDRAGVHVVRGRVATNEYLQTSVPHIYSGGDAIGGSGLAPVATYHGQVAARNALLGNVETVDHRLVPYTVFTRPSLSSVGLTEAQARARLGRVQVARVAFGAVERAMVEGETEGLVKVVVDADSGAILGAHILGVQSEELIHLFGVAMKGNLTCQEMGRIIPVNPSLSEAVIAAAARAGRMERTAAAGEAPAAARARHHG